MQGLPLVAGGVRSGEATEGNGVADAVVGNVMAVESFLLRGVGLACECVQRDVRSGGEAQGAMPPSCAILLIFYSLFAHCHTPFTLDCFNRSSTAITSHLRAGLTRFPSDLNK